MRIMLFLLISFYFASCNQKESKTGPQKPLARLMEGNNRFVNNQSEHPNRSKERRKEIKSAQTPFAVILGCSDSRVVPEIIFDEGLGDLFVVRIAGNIIGPTELDSIEYAALYLHSKIILVLSHENCGAVDAVVQNKTADIKTVADLIEPSVRIAEKSGRDNLLERAIKTNAMQMKIFLEKSPVIKRLIKDGKIEVDAAYYNLKTGIVEILKENK